MESQSSSPSNSLSMPLSHFLSPLSISPLPPFSLSLPPSGGQSPWMDWEKIFVYLTGLHYSCLSSPNSIFPPKSNDRIEAIERDLADWQSLHHAQQYLHSHFQAH